MFRLQQWNLRALTAPGFPFSLDYLIDYLLENALFPMKTLAELKPHLLDAYGRRRKLHELHFIILFPIGVAPAKRHRKKPSAENLNADLRLSL